MQVKSLKSMFARNRPILDEHEAAKRNRRNGLIGVLVIAAVLAATGVAFVNTSGIEDLRATSAGLWRAARGR